MTTKLQKSFWPMAAQLSWHVQYFIVMILIEFEENEMEFLLNY